MRFNFATFIMTSLFAIHCFAETSICEKQNVYTRIDIKNGQIQCVDKKANVVVQSAPLTDDLRYENKFELIDIPRSGFTEGQKKIANLLNLEAKWISGKMYFVAEGKRFPVGPKETLLVTKYLAQKQAGLPTQPLTSKEEAQLEASINAIRGAVQKLTDDMVSGVEVSPHTYRKMVTMSTDMATAIEKVDSVASASSTLVVTMIDANPSAYLMDSLVYTHGGSATDGGFIVKIKTAGGNLRCSGMSDTNNLPRNVVGAQVDWNFAPLTLFSYSCTSNLCTALVDTSTTNNICTATADKIFASGLEGTER